MAVAIKGGANTNQANVDANQNLAVNTPTNLAQSGFLVATGEVTDGVAGVSVLRRPMDISPDFRQRMGVDQTLWYDVFNHSVINTSKYMGVTSTMTNSMGSGFFTLNSGSALASGNVSRVQTWKTFGIPQSGALYVDMEIAFAIQPLANAIAEWGLGYASGIASPTDGCFFRQYAGAVYGVVNNNGAETLVNLTTAGFSYTVNMVNHYLIVIHTDRVEFWVNDRMFGAISLMGTTATLSSMSLSLPALFRVYNAAAVASALVMKMAAFGVTQADIAMNRSWETSQSGMGLSATNSPDGQTAGQLANYGNSSAPASATLSNTAAGYSNLGGQWQFAAVAGAETDYALFGYQVPAGAANMPGRNLIIRGIHIETFNTVVAVATTPTIFQWGLGIGGSALSLATVDSATAGTRAHRRVALGCQYLPIGAVVGQQANSLDFQFPVPIVVEAGAFIVIDLKMPVGTATSTEIFRGTCFVNAYFE